MLNILSASQCGFLFFDPYKFVNVCFCSEQETDRTTYSSDIDDRTLHEIYAHPFLKSVMAGVGSIMCSYSTSSCFSRSSLTDILFCRSSQWHLRMRK